MGGKNTHTHIYIYILVVVSIKKFNSFSEIWLNFHHIHYKNSLKIVISLSLFLIKARNNTSDER